MNEKSGLSRLENKKIALEQFEFNNMWIEHIELYREALIK